MELSIIIVSYNVKDYLRNCLISVRNASTGIDHEIFVVDNRSEDGSQEMVRVEFPDISLISNEKNLGFSAANNQAIVRSKGQFVLLLNPDTLVPKDAFSKCIRFMKENNDAGMLGVRMVNGDGNFLPESKRAIPTPSAAFFKLTGFYRLFPSSDLFNRYYLPETGNDETAPVEVIPGAFMFLRKEALDRAGLLDEDYFMYGEDVELSYQILKAGYRNYYYPQVQITHFKGKSTRKDGYSDIFHFYRAMRIFSRKRQKEHFRLIYFFMIPAIRVKEVLSLCGRFFHHIVSASIFFIKHFIKMVV